MQPSKILQQLPFFVYGTLRTGQENWLLCLQGRTALEMPATLPDHKMYFSVYPCVADAEDGSRVIGNLVYVEDDYEAVLHDLDQLEIYDADTDSGLYRRVIRQAEYEDEQGQLHRAQAWVYHAGPHLLSYLTDAERVAGGDWLQFVQDGQ